MKEPNQHQLDHSTFPSEPDLTVQQRNALAKVYQYLLTLQDVKTNEDESKEQESPEGNPHTNKLVKPAVEQPDE